MKVLYITGHSFCGSTLTSFILDSHPDMISIGESSSSTVTKRKGAYPCSCGETLDTCSFFNSIYDAIKWQGEEFSPNDWNLDFRVGKSRLVNYLLTRNLPIQMIEKIRDYFLNSIPSFRNKINSIAHRNVLVFESILRLSGKRVFVDAQKDARRAHFINEIPGVDLKLVHLLRDAPGYIYSVKRRSNNFDRKKLRRHAKHWLRTIKRAEDLRKELSPEQSILIRYEDLCKNIETELGRITLMLEVEPFTFPIQFRNYDHHIVGNSPMRMGDSSAIVFDEKWKTGLSATELDEIRKITDPIRKKYNYID